MRDSALIQVSDEFVRIFSPYHEKFIADLKEVIPPEDRMWVPEEKVWEVSCGFYDEVVEMASWYFNVRVEIVNV